MWRGEHCYGAFRWCNENFVKVPTPIGDHAGCMRRKPRPDSCPISVRRSRDSDVALYESWITGQEIQRQWIRHPRQFWSIHDPTTESGAKTRECGFPDLDDWAVGQGSVTAGRYAPIHYQSLARGALGTGRVQPSRQACALRWVCFGRFGTASSAPRTYLPNRR